MNRFWKRILISAAIVFGSVAATLLLERLQFFRTLDLKAQDAHFVLRGPRKTSGIIIVGVDNKAINHYPALLSFWQPYYADGIRAAALGGAKVMVLDEAFSVNVQKYEKDNDQILASAFTETSPVMPVVCAFVASSVVQQANPDFVVPINMLSSAFGLAAIANLTDDADSFVRHQVLIEEPAPGVSTDQLKRSMALRAAESFSARMSCSKAAACFSPAAKSPPIPIAISPSTTPGQPTPSPSSPFTTS